MARIELRHATIRLVDGYSNTAAVNQPTTAPAVNDTTLTIDTLGTSEIIPVSARFTVVGSGDVYTITVSDANAVLTIDLGGATGGTFTITVAGQVTSALNYNDSVSTILTAVEALSTVASGDFTFTGAGTSGDPYILKATATGAYANTAVVLSGDLASLTGATGESATQTYAGGVTHDITFTPAIKTSNVPVDDAVITITGRTLEVKVGEGNMTYTENKEFNYDLDRGNLDTVREGDQQPVDWTLDFTWEFITSISGATTPTFEEAMKQTGAAASWVSSSNDICEPYAVDIEIEHVPNCSTDQIETTTIPDARYESLEHDIDAATVSAAGRSNSTQAIHARRAQIA